MSLLSRLFGGKPGPGKDPAPAHDPVEYEGFTIHPEPIKEGGTWRVAARIEKEIDGEVMSQQLIRADMISDPDQAAAESTRKAQRLIDERGERLFDRPR
ncbi:MAG: HlyU family transcriptional regulator [Phycisphaerales bacterium]